MPPLFELSKAQWQAIAAHLGWTEREAQTARLMFQDCERKTMAHELGCSPRTVRNFIDGVKKKTGAKDRGEFFLRIFQLHLDLQLLLARPRKRKKPTKPRKKRAKGPTKKNSPSRTKMR